MINFLEITKSRLRNKLLLHFFTNTDDEMYLREMALALREDPGNLSKELSKLEKEGVFISQFRGKQKYFFLNKAYLLFNELKSIIFKTIGIQGSLQEIINETSGIVSAFIYGSFATRKENASSDIDLCLIVKDSVFNENNFISKINKLEKTVSREINYIYYSDDEWKKQVSENDSFIINIKMGPKIVLKGDEL
ncbi:MAG: nucleotidyltransferase domain-containing protein [Chloroflexi bacterium]|nr:nucleotidyltransferase domain-containing protein [Chloroflexota bacterium]